MLVCAHILTMSLPSPPGGKGGTHGWRLSLRAAAVAYGEAECAGGARDVQAALQDLKLCMVALPQDARGQRESRPAAPVAVRTRSTFPGAARGSSAPPGGHHWEALEYEDPALDPRASSIRCLPMQVPSLQVAASNHSRLLAAWLLARVPALPPAAAPSEVAALALDQIQRAYWSCSRPVVPVAASSSVSSSVGTSSERCRGQALCFSMGAVRLRPTCRVGDWYVVPDSFATTLVE